MSTRADAAGTGPAGDSAAAGKDIVRGEARDDGFNVVAGEVVAGETYDGGDGTDTIYRSGNGAIDFAGTTLTSLKRLYAGPGATMTAAQAEALTYLTTNGATLAIATAETVDFTNGELTSSDAFALSSVGTLARRTGWPVARRPTRSTAARARTGSCSPHPTTRAERTSIASPISAERRAT